MSCPIVNKAFSPFSPSVSILLQPNRSWIGPTIVTLIITIIMSSTILVNSFFFLFI